MIPINELYNINLANSIMSTSPTLLYPLGQLDVVNLATFTLSTWPPLLCRHASSTIFVTINVIYMKIVSFGAIVLYLFIVILSKSECLWEREPFFTLLFPLFIAPFFIFYPYFPLQNTPFRGYTIILYKLPRAGKTCSWYRNVYCLVSEE